MKTLCAAVIIVNMTSTWTQYDQDTLNRAKKRCREIYKDAPCLKKFTKKSNDAYTAICGERE